MIKNDRYLLKQKQVRENHLNKATCIWKFIQHDFIVSKLNPGCSGYLDTIYKPWVLKNNMS